MEQKIKEKIEKWNKKFKDSLKIERYSLLTFRSVVAEMLLDLDELLEHKRNHCCSKKDRSAHDHFK